MHQFGFFFVPSQHYLVNNLNLIKMRIKVNNQEVVIFQGATVKDALLKSFSRDDIDKALINSVEAYDQWGHEIGLDSPLKPDQTITYQFKQ